MASEQGFNSEIQSLCANGCGFFGRAETRNLCSKCYRDVCLQEAAGQQAVAAAVGHRALIAPAVASAAVVVDLKEGKEEEGSKGEDGEEEKRRGRCGSCNKKVGLVRGFTCRCGHVYCSAHRYPEEHACTFDFRARGRDLLAKSNPVVQGDKLGDRI